MSKIDSNAIEQVVQAGIEKVSNNQSVSLNDLLKILQDAAPPAEIAEKEKVPLPAVISESQREAVDKLPSVFGSVVPDKRRALEQAEVVALIEERETLKELKDLVANRMDDQRTIIYNHLDVEAETDKRINDETEVDADGFYILEGKTPVPGQSNQFSREVRSATSPVLNAEALKALVEDPEVDFTHQEYLSMTTPMRVLDENKVMLAVKSNPDLVKVIAKATIPGKKGTALYLRKNKNK